MSAFRDAMQQIGSVQKPIKPVSGRGIVICAGGALMFTNAYVLVRALRDAVHCQLPIELWYFGAAELSPAMQLILLEQGVDLMDVFTVLEQYPCNIKNGWQLKPYAIMHSRFAEVLYLDADQVPVRDPQFLFETPEYRTSGAIFWPDIIDIKADNPIFRLAGLEGSARRSWESGQIVVNKARHWPSLQIALYLNEQADIVYKMIYGDKDTFLIAWQFAAASFTLVPHLPFQTLHMLVQRGFEGAPLFQHRTACKWNYAGAQREATGFIHWPACLRYLEELRQRWNGRLFCAPDRGLSARNEEMRLQRVGEFNLVRPGKSDTRLQLLFGHQIGAGRSDAVQNWYVTESSAGFELVLHDGDAVTARLTCLRAGKWVGEGLSPHTGSLALVEQSAAMSYSEAQGGPGLAAALVRASRFDPDRGAPTPALIAALQLLVQADPSIGAGLAELAGHAPHLRPFIIAILARQNDQTSEKIDYAIEIMEQGYTKAS